MGLVAADTGNRSGVRRPWGRRRFPALAVGLAAFLVAGCDGGDRPEELPCKFVVDEDLTRRIDCPDGTSATLPPAVVAPRAGAVSGTASLFGEPRRDGIEVWLALAPTDPDEGGDFLHARTDAEGRFRFDDVPPGVHTVVLEAPGFTPERRPVVADPGEYVLDPVVLRRGFASLAADRIELFPSPRAKAFAARYGEPSGFARLAYWEPGGAGMVPIAGRVLNSAYPNYFDAEGGLLHAIDIPIGSAGPGDLVRYEVDEGRLRVIAHDVEAFWPALGGEALLLRGQNFSLQAWNDRFTGADGSGGLQPIADSAPDFSAGPDFRLVAFGVGNTLVVWDMERMTGDTLGVAGSVRFSPDGAVCVSDGGGRLVVWDAEGPRLTPLGPASVQDVSFHDAGRRFVYLETEGASKRLVHVDLDRGAAPVPLRDRVESASYGPGDGGIAWIESRGAEEELYFLRALGEAPERIDHGVGIDNLVWSRDGRRLFFHVSQGGITRLEVFEPGLGAHTLEPDVLSWALLEPEGDGVFFRAVHRQGGTETVALNYWDPVTDAVLVVHTAVDPRMPTPSALSGPGRRLVFPDQDGGWWRWDPVTETRVFVGERTSSSWMQYEFLADGAVAFVERDGTLAFLAPDATERRLLGEGLPPDVGGLHVAPGLAERFSYLYGTASSPAGAAGTLVLVDRTAGRAIPLDDEVTDAVQGDTFVAYVRNVDDDEHPQCLFLASYPVDTP